MAATHDKNEHFSRGMEAFVRGDLSRSEVHFSTLLTRKPDHKQALVSRGAVRLKDERTALAIEDFDRAISLDARNARAYHLRGLAYERQGRKRAAVQDFDRALEIDPDYGAAYYSRATLLNQMGQTEAAAADMQMVAHMTRKNAVTYAHDNNLIHSEHLRVEDGMETELNR